MNQPIISKLRIYPIKSLGFLEVEEAEIGMHSLKNDRIFAMVDEDGRYVNGKRTSLVNQLKTTYDLEEGMVYFTKKTAKDPIGFELREENTDLNNYLSDFFDIKLRLIQDGQGRLMDIPFESSVTVVSEASLQYLQKDLDRYSLENMRLRFRSNIELSGVEAFWEEQLYIQPGVGVRFQMGDVEMIGISPRARCNVPPQSPVDGEMDFRFAKNMMESRNKHVDSLGNVLQYGKSPYFLTINVFVPKTEQGKKINLNDPIKNLESVQLRA